MNENNSWGCGCIKGRNVVEVDFCMCAWEAILSCYVLGCSVLAINACLQNYSSTWWLTLNLNGNARLRLIILKVI